VVKAIWRRSGAAPLHTDRGWPVLVIEERRPPISSRTSAVRRPGVPEICRFYGIVIKLFWNDHEPLARLDPLP
jgi:hypothetical protein